MTKEIDYAYPTSDSARAFKMQATGCWIVSTCTPGYFPKKLAGFKTEAEAVTYAKTLPCPFGRLWQSKYGSK